ncbi:hypothetical protein KRX54_03985 [Actinomycetaceae bacterium TAE3-ERU4]|nr:hypothetical protein [Actinomycetaceae bacterium TAE3-ERU4]
MRREKDLNNSSVTGLVRMDDEISVVTSRLEVGEIAVINVPDLDRASALELIEARPSAVLNAAPSVTGRYPTRGASTLLEAGVTLVDELGTGILALQEGQRVRVEDNCVYLADQLVAKGKLATVESVKAALANAKLGVGDQLQSFAINTSEFLKAEQPLLFDGVGLESLGSNFSARPVVVVGPGDRSREQLFSLYRFIRDRNAAIIAVGSGAKSVLKANLKPDLITGNIRAVPDEALRSGAEIVLHSPRLVPLKDPRLDSMGLAYSNVASSLDDTDLATVIAIHCEAELVIPLGAYESMEEFFDLGRLKMSSAFFTQLVSRGKIISPQAILLAYSRPLRAVYVWMLMLCAMAALMVAVSVTPLGRSLWLLLPVWGHWVFYGILGLIGLGLLVTVLASAGKGKK